MRFTFPLLLGAVTLAHLYVQVGRGPQPIQVSDLEAGDPVPELRLMSLRDGSGQLDVAACELLVVFDPGCPYCRRAADLERDLEDKSVRRTWVTPDSSASGRRFATLVRAESRVAWDSHIEATLKIRGVPAAVLLSEVGDVVDTWAYRGEEADSSIVDKCASANRESSGVRLLTSESAPGR